MAGRPYATDEDEAAAAIVNAAMMTDMCNAFMDRVEEARLADPTSQAELQPDPEDAALDVPEHVGDPDGASSATSRPRLDRLDRHHRPQFLKFRFSSVLPQTIPTRPKQSPSCMPEQSGHWLQEAAWHNR